MKAAIIFVAFALCIAVHAGNIRKHRALVKDPRSDLDAKNAAVANTPALKWDQIRNGWFNNNLAKLAAMQFPNMPVKRLIGTYTEEGVLRHCSNGNCGNWGPDYVYTNGQVGEVYAILNPGQKETIDVEFRYSWSSCSNKDTCMSHLLCKDVGRADTTPCEFASYMNAQRASLNGAGMELYNRAPAFALSDVSKYMKRNDIRVTKQGILVVREYYEPRGADLPNTVRETRGVYSADAFIPATYGADVQGLSADANARYTAATKGKFLTADQLVAKFFTKDNLDVAHMQNNYVEKVIGGYDSAIYTKDCNGGICQKWADQSIPPNDPKRFGGQGTISLKCSVPAGQPASCNIQMTMQGTYGWEYQAWAICNKVGSMVTKCDGFSGPSYFALGPDSNGQLKWLRQDFVKTVKDTDELYISDSGLVSRMKWHGNDAKNNNHLTFTDILTWSTPFADFESANKANCLSKATPDQILATAAAKKGLKNKIILQKGPLADLVKSAPYKSVDEAVLKIKGIGPINVAYVSFWYNFQC